MKNLKGGTKVEIYPSPSFLKKFKRKPSKGGKGYFDLSREKPQRDVFWTKFRNVSQKYFFWSSLCNFNRISAKIFERS
jgi:hypothetical protein